MYFFTLDETGTPIPEKDLLAWAAWMEKSTLRYVAKTWLYGCHVSTVFLGIGFSEQDAILWETMVFGALHGNGSDNMRRCRGTAKDALDMHNQFVQYVKDKLNKDRFINAIPLVTQSSTYALA